MNTKPTEYCRAAFEAWGNEQNQSGNPDRLYSAKAKAMHIRLPHIMWAAWQARSSKLLGPEDLEHVAKAIWDWEHDNRQSQVLDLEWSLLRSDYLCRAQVAKAAYNKGK